MVSDQALIMAWAESRMDGGSKCQQDMDRRMMNRARQLMRSLERWEAEQLEKQEAAS